MTATSPTLQAAVAEHLAAMGLPPDGGDSQRFEVVRVVGNIPYPIPNTTARKRAVKVHDLNHLVSGYLTDRVGELEISAWELASGGCQRYTVAWLLDLAGLLGGLMAAPLRTYRAFVRGRREQNLYHLPLETLYPMTLEEAHRIVSIPTQGLLRRLPTPLHFALTVIAALPAGAALTLLWYVTLPAWLIDRRRQPSRPPN